MSAPVLESLDVDAAPGLSVLAREILAGQRALPTAAPRLCELDRVELRAGPAWALPDWYAELRSEHRRWGASAASLANLEALHRGASCVITGQQPALLLGPLYTAYKILGAIALAAELQRRHGRPVVPVYWCGGDDSDFEEVRRAWTWQRGEGPFRAQLDARVWQPGQRVGSVHADAIAALERRALEALAPGASRDALLGHAASMAPLDGLGDRAAGWALRLFGASGLVVVDARSSRLRKLGEGLFDRYAGAHREITALLRAHTAALQAEGWSTPLDDRALESGLFALQGEFRRKLDPAEIPGARGERAASVLLRPLWQDENLAPVAAVLGPSELQYHVQLAPLYAMLGVEAARPAPRPHLTLWPREAPWIEPAGEHAHWLGGGAAAESALMAAQLPATWASAWENAREEVGTTLETLGARLEVERARQLAMHTRTRLFRDLELLRRRLARARAERDGLDLPLAARWLAVHGTPQERVLAAPLLWWWAGDAIEDVLGTVGAAYGAAIDAEQSPTWVLRGGTTW